MKIFYLFIIVFVLFTLSFSKETELSETDKKAVENEVLECMNSLTAAFDEVSPEKVLSHFVRTDDLTIATQGHLISGYSDVLETVKLHLSAVKKQSNKTLQNRIYVISKKAAVISTSKIAIITFKTGEEMTVPYALTVFLEKRGGQWEIVQYHN